MSNDRYIIVSVSLENDMQSYDLELATDALIGDLCTIITRQFGWFTNKYDEYDVVVLPESRTLNKSLTLDQEHVTDGMHLMFCAHRSGYDQQSVSRQSTSSGFAWKQVS